MKFGVRKADVKTRSSSGNVGFIRYFTKPETRILPLEEFGDWTEYWEHYSRSKQRSYPCTRDPETRDAASCEGCMSDDKQEAKAQRKLLLNAYNDDGYVNLYKVPGSTDVEWERHEKKNDGSVVGRWYNVLKYENSDGRVKYSVERDEKAEEDIKALQGKMRSHQEALQAAWEEVWGDEGDSESPIQEPPKKKKNKKKKSQFTPAEDDKPWNSKVEEDDEPPFDRPTPDKWDSMSEKELKNLFKQAGLPVPRTNDKEKLLRRLNQELETV